MRALVKRIETLYKKTSRLNIKVSIFTLNMFRDIIKKSELSFDQY